LVNDFLINQGINIKLLEVTPLILNEYDAIQWQEKLTQYHDYLEENGPPSNREGYNDMQQALSKFREYRSRLEAHFPSIVLSTAVKYPSGMSLLR